MCLIIASSNGSLPKDDLLTRAYNNNHHGWGIVWKSPRGIMVERGFKLNAALRAAHAASGLPYVLHFRNATAGTVTVRNNHPFRINGADGSFIYMAHNGSFPDEVVGRTNKDHSDTWYLARYYEKIRMASNWFSDPAWHKASNEWINHSKLVFMLESGAIHIVHEDAGKWHQMDGTGPAHDYWLSNEKSTQPAQPIYSGYTAPLGSTFSGYTSYGPAVARPGESYAQYHKRVRNYEVMPGIIAEPAPVTAITVLQPGTRTFTAPEVPSTSPGIVQSPRPLNCAQCNGLHTSDIFPFNGKYICQTCAHRRDLAVCNYCDTWEYSNFIYHMEGEHICNLCLHTAGLSSRLFEPIGIWQDGKMRVNPPRAGAASAAPVTPPVESRWDSAEDDEDIICIGDNYSDDNNGDFDDTEFGPICRVDDDRSITRHALAMAGDLDSDDEMAISQPVYPRISADADLSTVLDGGDLNDLVAVTIGSVDMVITRRTLVMYLNNALNSRTYGGNTSFTRVTVGSLKSQSCGTDVVVLPTGTRLIGKPLPPPARLSLPKCELISLASSAKI